MISDPLAAPVAARGAPHICGWQFGSRRPSSPGLLRHHTGGADPAATLAAPVVFGVLLLVQGVGFIVWTFHVRG